MMSVFQCFFFVKMIMLELHRFFQICNLTEVDAVLDNNRCSIFRLKENCPFIGF
jgi:hypothetical protein